MNNNQSMQEKLEIAERINELNLIYIKKIVLSFNYTVLDIGAGTGVFTIP